MHFNFCCALLLLISVFNFSKSAAVTDSICAAKGSGDCGDGCSLSGGVCSVSYDLFVASNGNDTNSCASESQACNTIAKAIQGQNGKNVKIGTGTFDLTTVIISEINLGYGFYGGSPTSTTLSATTLSFGADDSVFLLNNGASYLVISNLEIAIVNNITGGQFIYHLMDNYGANLDEETIIENVVFSTVSYNSLRRLITFQGGKFTLTNVKFSGFELGSQYFIYQDYYNGGIWTFTNLTIGNISLIDSYALLYDSHVDCNVTIANGVFENITTTDNISSTASYGAIYQAQSYSASSSKGALITSTLFRNINAFRSNSVIYIDSFGGAELQLTNCRFTNLIGKLSGAIAIGQWANGKSLKLTNCKFYNNSYTNSIGSRDISLGGQLSSYTAADFEDSCSVSCPPKIDSAIDDGLSQLCTPGNDEGYGTVDPADCPLIQNNVDLYIVQNATGNCIQTNPCGSLSTAYKVGSNNTLHLGAGIFWFAGFHITASVAKLCLYGNTAGGGAKTTLTVTTESYTADTYSAPVINGDSGTTFELVNATVDFLQGGPQFLISLGAVCLIQDVVFNGGDDTMFQGYMMQVLNLEFANVVIHNFAGDVGLINFQNDWNRPSNSFSTWSIVNTTLYAISFRNQFFYSSVFCDLDNTDYGLNILFDRCLFYEITGGLQYTDREDMGGVIMTVRNGAAERTWVMNNTVIRDIDGSANGINVFLAALVFNNNTNNVTTNFVIQNTVFQNCYGRIAGAIYHSSARPITLTNVRFIDNFYLQTSRSTFDFFTSFPAEFSQQNFNNVCSTSCQPVAPDSLVQYFSTTGNCPAVTSTSTMRLRLKAAMCPAFINNVTLFVSNTTTGNDNGQCTDEVTNTCATLNGALVKGAQNTIYLARNNIYPVSQIVLSTSLISVTLIGRSLTDTTLLPLFPSGDMAFVFRMASVSLNITTLTLNLTSQYPTMTGVSDGRLVYMTGDSAAAVGKVTFINVRIVFNTGYRPDYLIYTQGFSQVLFNIVTIIGPNVPIQRLISQDQILNESSLILSNVRIQNSVAEMSSYTLFSVGCDWGAIWNHTFRIEHTTFYNLTSLGNSENLSYLHTSSMSSSPLAYSFVIENSSFSEITSTFACLLAFQYSYVKPTIINSNFTMNSFQKAVLIFNNTPSSLSWTNTNFIGNTYTLYTAAFHAADVAIVYISINQTADWLDGTFTGSCSSSCPPRISNEPLSGWETNLPFCPIRPSCPRRENNTQVYVSRSPFSSDWGNCDQSSPCASILAGLSVGINNTINVDNGNYPILARAFVEEQTVMISGSGSGNTDIIATYSSSQNQYMQAIFNMSEGKIELTIEEVTVVISGSGNSFYLVYAYSNAENIFALSKSAIRLQDNFNGKLVYIVSNCTIIINRTTFTHQTIQGVLFDMESKWDPGDYSIYYNIIDSVFQNLTYTPSNPNSDIDFALFPYTFESYYEYYLIGYVIANTTFEDIESIIPRNSSPAGSATIFSQSSPHAECYTNVTNTTFSRIGSRLHYAVFSYNAQGQTDVPRFSNVTFTNCRSAQAGAIYVSNSAGPLYLTQVVFRSNVHGVGGSGGADVYYNSSVALTSSYVQQTCSWSCGSWLGPAQNYADLVTQCSGGNLQCPVFRDNSTFYVGVNGNDEHTCTTSNAPCATIAEALSRGVNNTIQLGPGNFEISNYVYNTSLNSSFNGTVVYSGAGPTTTILSSLTPLVGRQQVYNFPLQFQHLAIHIFNGTTDFFSFLFLRDNNASVVINDTVIEYNAEAYPGIFLEVEYGKATLFNSVLAAGSSFKGSFILYRLNTGVNLLLSNFTATSVIHTAVSSFGGLINSSSTNPSGGEINITINNSTFENITSDVLISNTTRVRSLIWLQAYSVASRITINGSVFRDIHIPQLRSFIGFNTNDTGVTNITTSHFTSNRGFYAGAIYVVSGAQHYNNVQFRNNSCVAYGLGTGNDIAVGQAENEYNPTFFVSVCSSSCNLFKMSDLNGALDDFLITPCSGGDPSGAGNYVCPSGANETGPIIEGDDLAAILDNLVKPNNIVVPEGAFGLTLVTTSLNLNSQDVPVPTNYSIQGAAQHITHITPNPPGNASAVITVIPDVTFTLGQLTAVLSWSSQTSFVYLFNSADVVSHGRLSNAGANPRFIASDVRFVANGTGLPRHVVYSVNGDTTILGCTFDSSIFRAAIYYSSNTGSLSIRTTTIRNITYTGSHSLIRDTDDLDLKNGFQLTLFETNFSSIQHSGRLYPSNSNYGLVYSLINQNTSRTVNFTYCAFRNLSANFFYAQMYFSNTHPGVTFATTIFHQCSGKFAGAVYAVSGTQAFENVSFYENTFTDGSSGNGNDVTITTPNYVYIGNFINSCSTSAVPHLVYGTSKTQQNLSPCSVTDPGEGPLNPCYETIRPTDGGSVYVYFEGSDAYHGTTIQCAVETLHESFLKGNNLTIILSGHHHILSKSRINQNQRFMVDGIEGATIEIDKFYNPADPNQFLLVWITGGNLSLTTLTLDVSPFSFISGNTTGRTVYSRQIFAVESEGTLLLKGVSVNASIDVPEGGYRPDAFLFSFVDSGTVQFTNTTFTGRYTNSLVQLEGATSQSTVSVSLINVSLSDIEYYSLEATRTNGITHALFSFLTENAPTYSSVFNATSFVVKNITVLGSHNTREFAVLLDSSSHGGDTTVVLITNSSFADFHSMTLQAAITISGQDVGEGTTYPSVNISQSNFTNLEGQYAGAFYIISQIKLILNETTFRANSHQALGGRYGSDITFHYVGLTWIKPEELFFDSCSIESEKPKVADVSEKRFDSYFISAACGNEDELGEENENNGTNNGTGNETNNGTGNGTDNGTGDRGGDNNSSSKSSNTGAIIALVVVVVVVVVVLVIVVIVVIVVVRKKGEKERQLQSELDTAKKQRQAEERQREKEYKKNEKELSRETEDFSVIADNSFAPNPVKRVEVKEEELEEEMEEEVEDLD